VVTDRHPEADHELCLNRLLSAPAESWREGRRQTLGEMLAEAGSTGGHEARRAVQGYGLKLVNADIRAVGTGQKVAGLCVANHHQGLERVFADTRWAAGVWKQALLRVPGAAPAPRPMKFAGALARAVLLPPEAFRDAGGEEED